MPITMPLVRTVAPHSSPLLRSDTLERMMYEKDIVEGLYQGLERAEKGSSSSCFSMEPQTSYTSDELPSTILYPYTILSEGKKVLTLLIASLAAFLSPVSANIYYPALNPLSEDLNVSMSMINLTITSFMVLQAISPLFIASFSDKNGRRPALLICLFIYLMVNVGLSLQHDYVALLSLRCLQSFGSSGTTVLSNAVTADIVTRAERGKYLAYSSLGSTLGPALGPLIGGVLNQYFGWRSTFWFLTIFAGIMLLFAVVFFPETGRNVVGNGSVLPSKWNQSVIQLIYEKKQCSIQPSGPRPNLCERFPNPFDSLKLAFEKETCIIIVVSGLVYGGYVSVLSSMPSQLAENYGLNSLEVGLCYLPYGLGSLTSRWTVGKLVDWNFRRHARRLGTELVRNRQLHLDDFPLEQARIQIILPLVYSASIFIIIYSWLMYAGVPIAGPLIILFFISHTVSGSTTTLTTLIIDCHVDRPATACAANNLFRCLIGAAAVGAAVPLIEMIDIGWTGTLVSVFWILCSPLLWIVYEHGHRWRKEKIARERNADIRKYLSEVQ